jgi:manganese-dependent inorganic pyrophosphatase
MSCSGISRFNFTYLHTNSTLLPKKQNAPSNKNVTNTLTMPQLQMSPISWLHKTDLVNFGSSLEKIDKKQTNNMVIITGHGNSETASDMDTLAATLSLAYLRSRQKPEYNFIPFIDPTKFDGEMKFALDKFAINDFPEHSFTTKDLSASDNKNIKGVTLVDTNSLSEITDKLKSESIIEIIDHHKLSGIKTSEAINVNIKPYGSTATLIYELFKENNIEIPADIAGLLLSGIISDTMLFTSETTKIKDKEASTELAKTANITDINEYGYNLLKANDKTNTASLPELVKTDLKPFKTGTAKEPNITVNQIKIYSKENLIKILNQKDKLLTAMEQERPGKDLNIMMITYLLPNQDKPSTYIFYNANTDYGQNLVAKAFPENIRKNKQENSFMIEGVSSRKLSIMKPIEKATIDILS